MNEDMIKQLWIATFKMATDNNEYLDAIGYANQAVDAFKAKFDNETVKACKHEWINGGVAEMCFKCGALKSNGIIEPLVGEGTKSAEEVTDENERIINLLHKEAFGFNETIAELRVENKQLKNEILRMKTVLDINGFYLGDNISISNLKRQELRFKKTAGLNKRDQLTKDYILKNSIPDNGVVVSEFSENDVVVTIYWKEDGSKVTAIEIEKFAGSTSNSCRFDTVSFYKYNK